MTPFPGTSAPLDAVKTWLRSVAKTGKAMKCPCCDQTVKVYKRPLPAKAAMILCRMYASARQEWQHVPTLRSRLNLGNDGDTGKLQYWGLVEEATERRDDGGRAGWWRVTSLGRDFVMRQVTVAKYAYVYNDQVLGYANPQIDIEDALRNRFDYAELMAGV